MNGGRIADWRRSCTEKLLELIFPSNIYCIACGAIIDKSRPYALCDRCRKEFHWVNGRTCGQCGKPLQDHYLHQTCTDCREEGHLFEKGYACVQYGLREREMLLAYKYADRPYAGRKLAEVMADRIAREKLAAEVIVPVPLHKDRQKKRGYNQAEILAAHLAKKMELPCLKNALSRAAKTAPMSRLSPWERRKNIAGAFRVTQEEAEKLKGKRVLLVDDIYTTGSTADACSAALLASGAESVVIYCFAAGANRMQSGSEEPSGSVVESSCQLRAKEPT